MKTYKERRTERERKINSFKVLGISLPPLARNLPVDGVRRNELYRFMREEYEVVLPNYYNVNRANLDKEDLVVMDDVWWIDYEYDGWKCSLVISMGAIIDYASVPNIAVRGDLRQRGQHIDEPACMHDSFVALHLWPLEDANNIMMGMIDYLGLTNRYARFKYELGIRSRKCKKVYNSIKPEDHWLKDFVFHAKERI